MSSRLSLFNKLPSGYSRYKYDNLPNIDKGSTPMLHCSRPISGELRPLQDKALKGKEGL